MANGLETRENKTTNIFSLLWNTPTRAWYKILRGEVYFTFSFLFFSCVHVCIPRHWAAKIEKWLVCIYNDPSGLSHQTLGETPLIKCDFDNQCPLRIWCDWFWLPAHIKSRSSSIIWERKYEHKSKLHYPGTIIMMVSAVVISAWAEILSR